MFRCEPRLVALAVRQLSDAEAYRLWRVMEWHLSYLQECGVRLARTVWGWAWES